MMNWVMESVVRGDMLMKECTYFIASGVSAPDAMKL